jgi:hypothetical protein
VRLELKEIDITKNREHQDSRHSEVAEGRLYLGMVGGRLFVLRPVAVWYGWSMDGWVNPAGIQLDAVERLWEIGNPEELLARPGKRRKP